jgi:hypothetical protein
MTERRRFLQTGAGITTAAAAALIDAPNAIAQPKVQWRMSTTWTPSLITAGAGGGITGVTGSAGPVNSAAWALASTRTRAPAGSEAPTTRAREPTSESSRSRPSAARAWIVARQLAVHQRAHGHGGRGKQRRRRRRRLEQDRAATPDQQQRRQHAGHHRQRVSRHGGCPYVSFQSSAIAGGCQRRSRRVGWLAAAVLIGMYAVYLLDAQRASGGKAATGGSRELDRRPSPDHPVGADR